MTPVREWIVKELKRLIPAGETYWSDTNRKVFYDLTGLTHEDLLFKWEGAIDPKTHTRPGNGSDPTFTTCTSFLPRFATSVRIAGNLPTEKKNFYDGKTYEIKFRSFEQPKEKGWVPASSGKKPQPGDFFLYGYGATPVHCGVILDVSEDGTQWAKVAGGAGGRSAGHDGVKRTLLEPHAEPVIGWVDVDVYFEGWTEDIYADL